jgi:hypothetical protein
MSIELSIIMDAFCESRTAPDCELSRRVLQMSGLLHVFEVGLRHSKCIAAVSYVPGSLYCRFSQQLPLMPAECQ